MIQIDGAYGEGGGQILRTALALSALTRMPFRATRIRRNRPQPGLKPQHLHCIRAMEMWSGARAEGARPGADNVAFFPGRTAARELEIDIGTAGSVTLLLQALLPPMLFAGGSTRISLSGGTDTRWSIPLDYFIHVILPHFTEFAEITIRSTRRGFYPRGGGNLSLQIVPRISAPEDGLPVLLDAIAARFDPLSLHNAPEIIEIRGRSVASRPLQKSHVARRQAEGARRRLYTAKPLHLQEEYVQTESIGTVITLWAVGSDGRSRCGGDALGKRGVPAEAVGSAAAARLMAALESGAGVDHHLADNLIPLMALAGGTMVAERITGHIRSSVYVCEKFLGPRLRLDERRRRITTERP